jgi:hypothetical protein
VVTNAVREPRRSSSVLMTCVVAVLEDVDRMGLQPGLVQTAHDAFDQVVAVGSASCRKKEHLFSASKPTMSVKRASDVGADKQ